MVEVTKSVNVVVEGKVVEEPIVTGGEGTGTENLVDPTPDTNLTKKDKLIIKAKGLEIETDGLTIPQLEAAIAEKEKPAE